MRLSEAATRATEPPDNSPRTRAVDHARGVQITAATQLHVELCDSTLHAELGAAAAFERQLARVETIDARPRATTECQLTALELSVGPIAVRWSEVRFFAASLLRPSASPTGIGLLREGARGANRPGMRLLHTMLRVGDLQRSIDFYTHVLGMRLLRTTERPEQKYSLAFVGYGTNPQHAEIELTYNHGVDSYELGTAYGHIALGVPNVSAACDRIRAAGGSITREPGPVKGGNTVIAFVADPDGYKIELIERPAKLTA